MRGTMVALYAAIIFSSQISSAAMAGDDELVAGTQFSDCQACPQMIVLPNGDFDMGDLNGGGLESERPVHHVTIGKPFAIGVFEVSFDEWDACIAEGGCKHRPDDGGWGRGRRAVRNVNWQDAKVYIGWLSRKVGKSYRLLTEAEWEFAARAGTSTVYPWGDDLGEGNAVCLSCKIGAAMSIEVGKAPANQFGLFDMVGSQAEWVADCWNTSYEGAPVDGSAWTEGDCKRKVLRGGRWYDMGRFIRSASRATALEHDREDTNGIRVARDLLP